MRNVFGGFLEFVSSILVTGLVLLALVSAINDYPTNLTLGVVGISVVLAGLDWLRNDLFHKFTAAGWLFVAFFWGISLVFV